MTGDYLRVAVTEVATKDSRVDEGFARIERIEHLPEAAARRTLSSEWAFGPVPVVWCHGVPGPLLLHDGDVPMLDQTSPRRVEHDTSDCWWPPPECVLMKGHVAGDRPYFRRSNPDRLIGNVDCRTSSSPSRSPRQATGFAKPASALRVGDYLRIHTNRWPDNDRNIDAGFARVEYVRILDPNSAEKLFADFSWHTTVVAVSSYGLPGVLLLRADDELTVMAYVNIEREAWERRNQWTSEPSVELFGSRSPTIAEQQRADHFDAAHRPKVDEVDWYPSRYDNEFERRLALESVYGFRAVPLSGLPWPHHQSDCPLYRVAKTDKLGAPDAQAAHAAAFLSKRGQRAMAACPYHQPDWPRLVRIVQDTLNQAKGDELDPKRHPEYSQLAENEKQWLSTLVFEPIEWDDRDETLINGQHRLCALRAARVAACPVRGNFLPDTNYGGSLDASVHARSSIIASWHRYVTERGWPAWSGHLASKLPRLLRALLIAAGGS
jgi:hypothetical protein